MEADKARFLKMPCYPSTSSWKEAILKELWATAVKGLKGKIAFRSQADAI